MMKETLADPIDRASEEQQRQLDVQLQAARDKAAKEPKLAYIGKCYNCDEPLGGELRFCDSFCVEDYERIKRANSPAFRRLG